MTPSTDKTHAQAMPPHAVQLPADPQMVLLRARFIVGHHLRRARTRADAGDHAYSIEFAALRTLHELGFIELEQLRRWSDECQRRYTAAHDAITNPHAKQVPA